MSGHNKTRIEKIFNKPLYFKIDWNILKFPLYSNLWITLTETVYPFDCTYIHFVVMIWMITKIQYIYSLKKKNIYIYIFASGKCKTLCLVDNGCTSLSYSPTDDSKFRCFLASQEYTGTMTASTNSITLVKTTSSTSSTTKSTTRSTSSTTKSTTDLITTTTTTTTTTTSEYYGCSREIIIVGVHWLLLSIN